MCRRRSVINFLAVWLTILGGLHPNLFAQQKYSPEHPEVEKMVRRALTGLEKTDIPGSSGDKALAALTFVECGKRYDAVVPVDHPVVVEAVKAIEEDLSSGQLKRDDSVYYGALALILLCDVGRDKYSSQIKEIVQILGERQQPSGAFTYLKNNYQNHGDTSQTQYAGLAMWVAHKRGFNVPLVMPQKTLQWLTKVNLPNGGWVYHYSNDQPNRRGARTTLSIQAASLGTTYLLSDLLQLNPARKNQGRKAKKVDPEISELVKTGTGLPPSVSIYIPPDSEGKQAIPRREGPLVKMDSGKLAAVKRAGNLYLSQNFEIESKWWGYYFLYALERYAYFREKAEGSVREIPDWFDQGVELLKTKQGDDGLFNQISSVENKFRATCFACLFLARSSEILVLPSGSGNLSGGEGLPKDVRLEMVNGKVKSFSVVNNLGDVLELLDAEEFDEQQYELIRDSLTRSIEQMAGNSRRSNRQQLSFLRGLVSDKNYFKRLIAVRLLSRSQDMDNVPALIYALGDPDLRICREAHNGLRLISRKLDSIKISDSPGYAEYQNVKKQWTDWFLSIRPGAELLD